MSWKIKNFFLGVNICFIKVFGFLISGKCKINIKSLNMEVRVSSKKTRYLKFILTWRKVIITTTENMNEEVKSLKVL